MSKRKVATIDCTPTWEGVLRLYLTVWTDGDLKGRETAIAELRKMAQLADKWVGLLAVMKKFQGADISADAALETIAEYVNNHMKK